MTEYIEREQARNVICGWCEYTTCLADDYYWDKCDAKRRLGDIPTADVQHVVRCKECRWWNEGYCRLIKYETTDDWFCADGWRKI